MDTAIAIDSTTKAKIKQLAGGRKMVDLLRELADNGLEEPRRMRRLELSLMRLENRLRTIQDKVQIIMERDC